MKPAGTTQSGIETPKPAGSILRRIASGDQSAVHDCIETFGPLVWSMARRMSQTPADAEDAMQEIFIDIWRSASRFDPTLGMDQVFIATIARRRLIDRLRGKGAQRITVPLEILDFLPVSEVTGAAELSFDVEQASRALGELQATHREVLELSLVQGLTHSEIATKLQMPLGTVKSYIRRGLMRVRELINVSVVQTKVRSDV